MSRSDLADALDILRRIGCALFAMGFADKMDAMMQMHHTFDIGYLAAFFIFSLAALTPSRTALAEQKD